MNNNKGQNFYGGGGNYGNRYGMGSVEPSGRDDSRMVVWEATRLLQEGFLSHAAEMPRLLELVHNLSRYLENTRAQYNRSVNERDAAQRRLQEANNKLSQVENLVKRFAVVRNPVIASDGFTYERESITKYLNECSSGNSKAYSQQTKEELTDVTVPNKSLNRLVTHLKEVHPIEVPPPTHRGPINAVPGPVAPRSAWMEDEHGGGANMGPRPVPPLDANTPPHVPSGIGMGAAPAGAGASIGGITVPAPASASNNAGRGGRFEGGKMRGAGGAGGAGGRPALHPCLRVYGFCNFMDDCTFANYPYEACLNHIKGKCRFGQNCKELHVDPREPRYQNTRSYANQHNHANHANQHNHINPANQALPAHPAGPNASAPAEPKAEERVDDRKAEKPAASSADDKQGERAAGAKDEKKAGNEAIKAAEAAAAASSTAAMEKKEHAEGAKEGRY